jgi:glutamine amidotransferase
VRSRAWWDSSRRSAAATASRTRCSCRSQASDGHDLWFFRYSSEGRSRSLFHSTDIAALRKLYPDVPQFKAVSENTRLVVSEPFSDLAGAWNEVPEGTCGWVREGEDRLTPFAPIA